jgi:serine/threonine-protein kinase
MMSETRYRPDRDGDDIASERRTEVEAARETSRVKATRPAVPPGVNGPGEVVVEEGGTRLVSEEERIRTLDDGSVERRVERREHDPPRRRAVFGGQGWLAGLLALLAVVIAAVALAAWYVSQEDEVAVPDVVGLPVDEAVARLDDEGLDANLTGGTSDEPVGTVFEQDPAAGATLDEGSTVDVGVSEGPDEVQVPNAIGVSEAEARDRLAQEGLGVRVVDIFSDRPEGTVVAQNPAAGETTSPDTVVRLNVSKGEGTVVVPSLVGQQREAAEQRLDELGLEANVVTVPSAEPEGVVVAQNPSSGEVQVGSSIRLNVSDGTQ